MGRRREQWEQSPDEVAYRVLRLAGSFRPVEQGRRMAFQVDRLLQTIREAIEYEREYKGGCDG